MRIDPPRATLGFLAGALALLGALGWISARTLDLERAEIESLARAAWEEDIRLSLWRMDAAIAAWISLENARSPVAFLEPGEAAGTARAAGPPPGDLVRARFELDPSGAFRSRPAVDPPSWAERLVSPRQIARLTGGVEDDGIPEVLEERIRMGNQDGRQSPLAQSRINVQEFSKRRSLMRQSAAPTARVRSPLAALWMGDDLLLARVVDRDGGARVQGSWLDWDAVRGWLTAEVGELLPEAALEPLPAAPERGDPGRRLALLPVKLEPGAPPIRPPVGWTPVRLTLAVAWGTVLLALGGLGLLLWSAVAMSQRRGDFVSAVTHELRTPLTTFRLYSDLLADDDLRPEERREYLATVRREAARLGHLVDNVLDFSRLERRAAARPSSHRLGELVERIRPRLAERAERGGLDLRLGCAPEHRELPVLVDPDSVERILLNLVDNACKYGRNPERPILVVDTARTRRRVILRVSDFGDGVPAEARGRLFRPFQRAGDPQAAAVPGIGLGLAISRRLARAFGGDLRLAASGEGAVFELLLPGVAGEEVRLD